MPKEKTPGSIDDLNERIKRNQRITGFGIQGTKIWLACPFCGAPDFMCYTLPTMERVMDAGAKCPECKRGMRTILQRDAGGTRMEFVQTDGDDLPNWYQPKMRRV